MDQQNKLTLQKLLIAFIITFSMTFISCGDNAPQDPSKFSNTKKVVDASGLSDFELENGIGPIKQNRINCY